MKTNMKTKWGGWTLIAVMLLVGCVPSLNPVYTEDQLVFDPSVLGAWVQQGSANRWEFSKRDENSYQLLYTDKDGQQGRFVARLADVDDLRFLDLFPEERDTESSGFYKLHMVPVHTFYLVKQMEPSLELAAINHAWLAKYLSGDPEALESATFNGRMVLTAPTDELQAFVLEHREMFAGDFSLVRQRP